MTRLEMFAAAALTGLCAAHPDYAHMSLVREAFGIADAMEAKAKNRDEKAKADRTAEQAKCPRATPQRCSESHLLGDFALISAS